MIALQLILFINMFSCLQELGPRWLSSSYIERQANSTQYRSNHPTTKSLPGPLLGWRCTRIWPCLDCRRHCINRYMAMLLAKLVTSITTKQKPWTLLFYWVNFTQQSFNLLFYWKHMDQFLSPRLIFIVIWILPVPKFIHRVAFLNWPSRQQISKRRYVLLWARALCKKFISLGGNTNQQQFI